MLVNTEPCASDNYKADLSLFCQPIYNNTAWLLVVPKHFQAKQAVVLFLNLCVVVVTLQLV